MLSGLSYPILSIIRDWRRASPIIAMLILAGLQMSYSLSGFVTLYQAYSAHIHQVASDIWLVSPDNINHGVEGENMGERYALHHRGVKRIFPVYSADEVIISKRQGDFANPAVANSAAFLQSVNVGHAQANQLTSFPEPAREALARPGSVAMMDYDARQLGISIGDSILVSSATAVDDEQNEPKPLVLAAVINDTPSIVGVKLFVSHETADYVFGGKSATEQRNHYLLGHALQIKSGWDASPVVEQLNTYLSAKGVPLRAMSTDTLLQTTSTANLLTEAEGRRQLTSLLAIVGTVLLMTFIIMRANFVGQIQQFAALHAFGFSYPRLISLLLAQALLLGTFASLLFVALYVAGAWALKSIFILVSVDPLVLLLVSTIMITVTMIAGLLSISVLARVDLMSLLR